MRKAKHNHFFRVCFSRERLVRDLGHESERVLQYNVEQGMHCVFLKGLEPGDQGVGVENRQIKKIHFSCFF